MCEDLFTPPMQSHEQGYKSSDGDPPFHLPTPMDPAFEALQLMEVLRAVLEGQKSEDDQAALSKQTSKDTANVILQWLQTCEVNILDIIYIIIYFHSQQQVLHTSNKHNNIVKNGKLCACTYHQNITF